jgi:Fe2+ or Zn2+ uptake regulation protein
MEWEQCLTEAGCRVTQARRAVIAVLSATDVPLSPQEILRQGAAIHPSLGLVTVYRTVALLEDLGLVQRPHHSEGCHGYLPTLPGHRHHVVCTHCGRTAQFLGGEGLDDLIARVEHGTRYRVDHHMLQFEGLCPTCQERGA